MNAAGSAPSRRRDGTVGVEDAFDFDEIIDARSPAEFAEDHLPGAINLPVLDDEERARVGTLHKQASAFEAKKDGAALVSRNIARHLETVLADRPRHYRPLVYCWRGGNRSGAFVTVLRAIGWNACQLDGGYKAFRRHVIAELETLPERFEFRVVCGPTGTGKSRFLKALARCGAQVLDLEDLAAHMGSVLGAYPDRPQPTQKLFETRVWHALGRFRDTQPVFVESESKKIGNLHTPEQLLARMRASACVNLEADIPVRVELLKQEYAHFLADAETFNRQLDCLVPLLGRERVGAWKDQARAGRWDELVADLLVHHYDPAYARSLGRNYPQGLTGPRLSLTSADAESVQELARRHLAGLA